MKILVIIFISAVKVFGQNPWPETEQKKWDHPAIKYNEVSIPSEFKNEDIVIVSDKATFDLTNYSTKALQKTVLLKILNNKGLLSVKSISLPESFDIAENAELVQQGRRSKIKIPYIKSFTVLYFMARVIKSNGKTIKLKPDKTFSEVRWISETGEYLNDYINNFSFDKLEVGDLLEYSYKMEYKTSYGNDMLYLASKWPKQKVEYSFRYLALPLFKHYKFILSSNIPDSCITLEHEKNNNDYTVVKERIKLENVQKVNYFIHALSAAQLPQVYFNMNYTIRLFNNRSYSVANLPDFKWANISPKDNYQWYTKYPLDIKKFVSSMPVFEQDTSSIKFMKAVSDTLNNFKYYSANYMYYNDPRLYNLFSTDHLFKRRISQMNMINIYKSILDEKGVFYYITNVQDKRLGEHNPLIRNRAYENIILSVPTKKAYSYFVPRYNGLKYFLNELPFYYEGAVAALFPVNYEKRESDTIGNHFKFIKTYSGSANENVRTENCTIKINNDSLSCNLAIKESLSGQFSTILRPLYLKEIIDSTINSIYFKKCVDKPNSLNKKIDLESKSEEYPFRFVFNCSENITLKKKGEIDLNNWFSFVYNKTLIPETPTHDFYFDFRFSDIYNFVLDPKINITNVNELASSYSNEYFEVSCVIRKQENAEPTELNISVNNNSDLPFETKQKNSNIFSVIIQVKQNMLPKEDARKLTEFVNELEKINNLKIYYSK